MAMSKEATFVVGAISAVVLMRALDKRKAQTAPQAPAQAPEPPQLPADLTRDEPAPEPVHVIGKAPRKAVRA